jgi:hypothetical protein
MPVASRGAGGSCAHESAPLVQREGEEEPSECERRAEADGQCLDRPVVAPAEDAAMEAEADSKEDALLVAEDAETELDIGVDVLSIVYLGCEC